MAGGVGPAPHHRTPPLRAVLLLNPRAGTLLDRPDLASLLPEALRGAGFALLDTGVADDAPLVERLEAALAAEPEVVVVGGGDGTIRTAAAHLAGTEVALAILPLGTLNVLARDLGMPLDPPAAAAALGEALFCSIDVATVNGEVFLCQSVIGLPNRMGQHREKVRGKDGLAARWRVALAFTRALWRYPPLRLGIRADGGRVTRLWARALSVVNNRYVEAPGRLFHRPRLDEGVLNLHAARSFGIWWGLRMLAAMAMGRWRRSSDLISTEGRSLEIRSRRRHLRVMNDGEALLLATPLRYEIRPGALRILAPPQPETRA